MSLFLSLAACFIPLIAGITLCLIFVKDFKILYAIQALVFGLAAVIMIILVRTFISDVAERIPFTLQGYLGVLVSVILFAFVEEFVKMVFIVFFSKKIETLKNFMLISLLFGCTVGSFETLMYLVTGFADTVPRLFTAVVVHTLCASLSGLFAWAMRHKFSFFRAFWMSFLLHGVYNFFASQTSFLWWFSIVTILFIVFKCRIYYSLLHEKESGIAHLS